MEKMINLNERILTNYQKIYPNLQGFSYDANDDALIYEGQKIKLNGNGLSKIDPVFFEMNPDDIFSYIKSGFYQNTPDSQQIISLFNQMIITEDEEHYLKSFVNNFNIRCRIYTNNKALLDSMCENNENVQAFTKELIESHRVIDEAKMSAYSNSAASILTQAYDNSINNQNKKDLQNSENQEQSINQGLTLTRTNNKFKFNLANFEESEQEYIEQKNHLSIAGFSSIILIIAVTITVGIFLAVTVLK